MKQAEPIRAEKEERLWSMGLLGQHSPQTLLDTIVFMCGTYFALRSGQEHRSLPVDQMKVVETAKIP